MKGTSPQERYQEALANHLATWGPHCGAPLVVYTGHLNKLLEAQRDAIKAEEPEKRPA